MRIGALIQARLGSERLPGKHLRPIAGTPALVHLLRRTFAAEPLDPERVVVCTTEEPEDDPLVELVEATGARVFRGSRDDIVDRFHGAARAFGFDAVVQVDGDDICAEPLYMELALERLLADDSLDVVVCEGLPLGMASKAIRARALERVHDAYVPGDNSTGASYYFTRSELCRSEAIGPVSDAHRHDTARLTLDYEEDVTFFEALFAVADPEAPGFGIEAIVAALRRHPEIVELNRAVEEEYWRRSAALTESEQLRYRTAEGLKAIHAP